MTRITTVVFDLGQVLVGWDPYGAFADQWTRDQFEEFVAEIDFPAFNHHQDAGRSISDARAALTATHPHRAADFDTYVANFAGSLTGPVPGSAEIVENLIAGGIRVLGLTNWSAETFHEAARAAPVIDRLEDILVSGEVGLAKPDPAIYELLVDRFDLATGPHRLHRRQPSERGRRCRGRPPRPPLHRRDGAPLGPAQPRPARLIAGDG